MTRRGSKLESLLVGAIAAASGLLFFFDPATRNLTPPCPLWWALGLYCPGCGSLRALHLLLHGDLGAALRMNSLLVVSLPVLAMFVARPRWTYAVWAPWAAVSVFTAYGVLRNVPAWPFSLLAPH
jgi:hypothetical protein